MDTCPSTGKRCLSRKEAQKQAAWWRYKNFARMGHYYCHKCKSWHIGNSKKPPKRKRY